MNPSRATRRLQIVTLASLAGTCIALSAPPDPSPTLSLLGCALFYGVLSHYELFRVDRARAAFLTGWWVGTVCNAIALRWTVGMLEEFGGFPWIGAMPTATLLYLAQGLPMGFAALFAVGMQTHRWVWFSLSLTFAYAMTPGIFPWHPAVTMVAWLPWVQLAEVGGEPVIDALWALAGAGAAHAFLKSSRSAAAIALAALVLPWGYGIHRISEIEEERLLVSVIPVGVVQPNIGIHEKHDPSLWFHHLHTLREQTRTLEAQGAALVIWPESAYPFTIPRGQTRDSVGETRVLADGVRGPILFGAVTSAGRCRRYNSVVGLSHRGEVVGVVDKVELLAFGEYVPLWDYLPPLQDAFPCRGLMPGQSPGLVEIAQARVGVLNCYEDVLPEYARSLVWQNPDFLVNVTNDAWFGDSDEPYLHQQVARLRSIETRRDLIRAVNTGVSAHITSTGAEAYATDTFEQTGFVAPVTPQTGLTPWVRYGDWFSPISALFLVWGLGVYRRRRDGYLRSAIST